MADCGVSALIEESDRCSKEKEWRKGIDLLSGYHETENPELLWRIIRDLYRKSKYFAKNATEAEELGRKGVELSKKAVSLDSGNHICYKWAGIILSHHSGLVGLKEKIITAVQVKEYFEKAIELNPEDMPSLHLLGRWHYQVASVTWFERRAAKVFFGNPPSSTYQEALKYFEAAEKLNTVEFVDNWLYLAKTYHQLSKYGQAKQWAAKVCEFSDTVSPDIAEAKAECEKLLRKL